MDVDQIKAIHSYNQLLTELYPSQYATEKTKKSQQLVNLVIQEPKTRRYRKVLSSSSSPSASASADESEEDKSEEELDDELDDESDDSDSTYEPSESSSKDSMEDRLIQMLVEKEHEIQSLQHQLNTKQKGQRQPKTKGKGNDKTKSNNKGKSQKKGKDEEQDKEQTNYNIIFTYHDDPYADEDEDSSSSFEDYMNHVMGKDKEHEDDPISSDNSSDDSSADSSTDEENESTTRKNKDKQSLRSKKRKRVSSRQREDEDADADTDADADEESPKQVVKRLKQLNKAMRHQPHIQHTLQSCIVNCEAAIEKDKAERRLQKIKDRNQRIFKRQLKPKELSDADFFEQLDAAEQNKTIKQLRQVNANIRIDKPYRLSLLQYDIPDAFKAVAMKKINMFQEVDSCSSEYPKLKNWVDTFMKIPFGIYHPLPLSLADGVEVCRAFLEKTHDELNKAVYGLDEAKLQLIQMMGQLIANPASVGSSIAIHGPPGTGKTSLIKDGVSHILGRPFALIALGGASDGSSLEGHSYTYEGSTWGKIVQILIDSKCMNPIIYFDELDKISDTPRGQEIAGILTHLTDTTQNDHFQDKYFSEIHLDVSKCLFIFSYNDESKINRILLDRMYKIKTEGYSSKQKVCIANQFMLPKVRDQLRFAPDDVVIPDKTIQHVVDRYCQKEQGVRNMKRCFETIHSKLNLCRMNASNLVKLPAVTFPVQVTNDLVDQLLKDQGQSLDASLAHLYV